ncbi:hypothetical protein [Nitrosophilus kaiyonis]|uniref:hypothetical protein n=1 Tax=Nitrosophilus kaiyonis TaxID=2930200 RepID=UPI00248FE3E4|nr:hypothetical protein [Nitrosophilus kaiyonis]
MIHFKPYTEPFEFLYLNKPLGKSISFKVGETIKAEVIDILPNGAVVARLKGQHVHIKTEIPLKKDTNLLLRVMDTQDSDKKLKLQILSTESRNKNILDKLENIDIKLNQDVYIKLSKNEHNKELILKQLIEKDFFNEYENLTKNMQNILKNLENKNIDNSLINSLKSQFINLSKIDFLQIKKAIEDSGIFFENKISKKIEKKDIIKDIKASLLSILDNTEDKDIKKEVSHLISSIQNYQLLSNLIDGIYTYLPLIWDELNDSEFIMKKGEKKNQYLCKIILDFVDYGKVDSTIFLFGDDLKIVFEIESKDFEKNLKNSIEVLKQELKKDGFENIFVSFGKGIDIKNLQKLSSIIDTKV